MKQLSVFVSPTWRHKDERGDGGIRRVSEALWSYLPDFGITPTTDADSADVLNCHGGTPFPRSDAPLVASNHGLYWSDYGWDAWAHDANRQVVDSLTRAQAITAPSKWVAHALTRGLLAYPEVIYHGVDPEAWQHSERSRGYVLWNKARADAVSNPEDMHALAELMPDVRFVSTLGRATNNVALCGVVGADEMKTIIQRAGVYLATARETFGIGTLEAMAAGVPVVGWDYGGQHEILVNGETGYLAPHGDYKALAQCVRLALQNREQIAAAAYDDVLRRWLWPDKVEKYAALFLRVYNEWHMPRPLVSVIVTCHNLAKYLPEALESVKAQTLTDWECIIVDDGSTDETESVSEHCSNGDSRFVYRKTPENLGLSGARNFGFRIARGRLFIPLDADDKFSPNTLETLSDALARDSGIHIAYGHLDTISEDGGNQQRNPWPTKEFDWRGQMAHLNQLPYAAMFRREVWERSGGYRLRAWRAEDAEHWCRVTSMGFRAAKVTEDSTLIYRIRSDSKGAQERQQFPDADGDWTAWFPWRLAGNAETGVQLLRTGYKVDPTRVPWGAQLKPPEDKRVRFFPVPHHASPLVSVIIPVGPGHEKYVLDAVESVFAQTFAEWEVIVVNDTGTPWTRETSPLRGAPYAKVVTASGSRGAGEARNAGAARARGELLVFLDADDYLLPSFLEETVAEWKASKRLVYTDCLAGAGLKSVVKHLIADDWECSRYDGDELRGVLHQLQHGTTCLLPVESFRAVGGFDEKMKGWEEWDFFIRLEETGLCSVHLPRPLYFYRLHLGQRRKYSEKNTDALRKQLYNAWKPYYRGEKEMACGSCPGSQSAYTPPPAEVLESGGPNSEAILVEYQGNSPNKFTMTGAETGAGYIFNNGNHQRKYVHVRDVAALTSISRHGVQQFRVVEKPRPTAPTPITVTETERQELPSMREYETRGQPEPTNGALLAVAPINISEMTLDDLRAAIPEASIERITEWRQQEENGKKRKSIIQALNRALSMVQDVA